MATGLSGTPGTGIWNDDDGTGALTNSILDVSGLTTGIYSFTYTVVDLPCADATATIIVDLSICIGIGTIAGQTMSLYPNPSEGKIMIEFGGTKDEVLILVYNGTGELIKEILSKGKANTEIDLRGEPNGLYYINVITEGDIVTTKVSIVR